MRISIVRKISNLPQINTGIVIDTVGTIRGLPTTSAENVIRTRESSIIRKSIFGNNNNSSSHIISINHLSIKTTPNRNHLARTKILVRSLKTPFSSKQYFLTKM